MVEESALVPWLSAEASANEMVLKLSLLFHPKGSMSSHAAVLCSSFFGRGWDDCRIFVFSNFTLFLDAENHRCNGYLPTEVFQQQV